MSNPKRRSVAIFVNAAAAVAWFAFLAPSFVGSPDALAYVVFAPIVGPPTLNIAALVALGGRIGPTAQTLIVMLFLGSGIGIALFIPAALLMAMADPVTAPLSLLWIVGSSLVCREILRSRQVGLAP